MEERNLPIGYWILPIFFRLGYWKDYRIRVILCIKYSVDKLRFTSFEKKKNIWFHDYLVGFLFSCSLVAALFLIICNRLSALINEELTLDGFVEEDEPVVLLLLLLLEELVDFGADFLAEPGFTLDRRPVFTVLGESDRLLLAKVTGLDRLLLGLALLAVFFIVLQQSEQYHTCRGSFTSPSVIAGRWHSWW